MVGGARTRAGLAGVAAEAETGVINVSVASAGKGMIVEDGKAEDDRASRVFSERTGSETTLAVVFDGICEGMGEEYKKGERNIKINHIISRCILSTKFDSIS